jgi:hypothetical protein
MALEAGVVRRFLGVILRELGEIVTILLIPVGARDMAIPTLPITHGRRICISLRNELDALYSLELV